MDWPPYELHCFALSAFSIWDFTEPEALDSLRVTQHLFRRKEWYFPITNGNQMAYFPEEITICAWASLPGLP